jgi:diguanylate cyclase (GGDEF)-like protein/PAS domain S-box-containing protein
MFCHFAKIRLVKLTSQGDSAVSRASIPEQKHAVQRGITIAVSAIVLPRPCPQNTMMRKRLHLIYIWLIIATGLAALIFSCSRLTQPQLDVRFFLLTLATVLIGPRLSIPIPRAKARISVSDTFIFVALLLFGGEAAIVLATVEGLCSSLNRGYKLRTNLFNAAVMASATFITVWTLRFSFVETSVWREASLQEYMVVLCVMAVVQYISNSVLVATGTALGADKPVWQMWRSNFLWTSITYFAGALAAGIVARFIGNIGFFAFTATIPIITIVYFTYWTYMKNVESAESQAEQARRHVEELNLYLAEQERISKALRETEEHFRNAFDYAAIGMALVSLQGTWLRVNRSLCELLGYTEPELLASNFQAVTHEDDVRSDLANLYRLIQDEIPTCQVEKRYMHRHGEIVWVLNSVSLIRDQDNNPVHFIFQIQDMTERKRAEAALQSLSVIDELTGLYNRRGFLAVAHQHLAAIRRDEKKPVILYGDLDGLKKINDSLGHHEGDRALTKVAEIFKDAFRSSDILARIGGDEFVVLAALDDEETAETLADRLQQRFKAANSAVNRAYDLAISVGVAHIEDGETRTMNELMARADQLMYEDKRLKRGREVLTPDFVKPRIEAVA